MSSSKIAQISALLAKAESTNFPEEAEAFFAKAQEIASKYSIDIAIARKLQGADVRTKPVVRDIVLAARSARGGRNMINLFNVIGRSNNLHCLNITGRGMDVTIRAFGFEEDIELTQMLYTSLLLQMTSSTRRFLDAGTWKSETDWYGKTVHGATVRNSFENAYVSRIGKRLAEAKDVVTKAESSGSTDLVLRDKRSEVQDFYNRNSGKVHKVTRRIAYSAAGVAGGTSAANRANLGSDSLSGARKAVSR